MTPEGAQPRRPLPAVCKSRTFCTCCATLFRLAEQCWSSHTCQALRRAASSVTLKHRSFLVPFIGRYLDRSFLMSDPSNVMPFLTSPLSLRPPIWLLTKISASSTQRIWRTSVAELPCSSQSQRVTCDHPALAT